MKGQLVRRGETNNASFNHAFWRDAGAILPWA